VHPQRYRHVIARRWRPGPTLRRSHTDEIVEVAGHLVALGIGHGLLALGIVGEQLGKCLRLPVFRRLARSLGGRFLLGLFGGFFLRSLGSRFFLRLFSRLLFGILRGFFLRCLLGGPLFRRLVRCLFPGDFRLLLLLGSFLRLFGFFRIIVLRRDCHIRCFGLLDIRELISFRKLAVSVVPRVLPARWSFTASLFGRGFSHLGLEILVVLSKGLSLHGLLAGCGQNQGWI